MLGAGTGETGRFPVLFAPETACALVDLLFQCASGTAIYRNASFLAGKEGEAIASPLVSVVSDPMRPRGLGSTPFDAQGVATSRRLLLDQGLLAFYPCDTFSARRLQRQSTGHAGSGGLSSHNLFVENGVRAPEEMLKQMGEGLLVTAFIGFGFNQATGDFSRGIRGFWVEGGRPVRPVQEMTVAGNLGEMLKDVVAVGNDLEHRFGTDSPSLLVREMSVAGG
jgi:PmbA protein